MRNYEKKRTRKMKNIKIDMCIRWVETEKESVMTGGGRGQSPYSGTKMRMKIKLCIKR